MPSLVPWHRDAATDDKRELLRARLVVYSRVTLVTFLVLALLVSAFQLFITNLRPERGTWLLPLEPAGVLPVGFIWLYLRGKERSIEQLYTTDAVLALYLGLFFGSAAYLIPDRAPNVFLPFIFMTFVVFTRVVVVPSHATRTLVVATLSVLPLLGAYVALVLLEPWRIDVPRVVFISGAAGLSCALVALAWVGSDVMYGLRREARDAQRLGQYTLCEKLGEGGMGEVYRATHAMLRRPTAIKLLKSDGTLSKKSLARFEREVQLTSQLRSPHTIHVYDYGTTPDGRFYYVMEYLDGVDLDRLVAGHGALPAPRVIYLLEQICSALSEAHELGLIHRDIKPANVIVCQLGDRRDFVKVFDFGLAKDLSDASGLTGSLVAGTPAYLAPETITDPQAVTAASDIYSLGCTAYFLITGSLVFEGKTVAEVCMHHVQGTPTPLSERAPHAVPAELEQLVMRCLEKQPSKRPASARELAKALRSLSAAHAWTEDDARAWWTGDGAKLAVRPESSDSFSPVTMTVDFADRQRDQGT